jgi:hypothetical protein
VGLGACGETVAPRADPDADVPATACGSGPPRLSLGVGLPYVPAPNHRFPVEQGLQGGFHVDVSLRVVGGFDPDSVNVRLALLDGERLLAEHRTDDWLFFIFPVGCDYPRARMVMLDERGGLLSPEVIPRVVERPLRLRVQLDSALGVVQETLDVTLTAPRA